MKRLSRLLLFIAAIALLAPACGKKGEVDPLSPTHDQKIISITVTEMPFTNLAGQDWDNDGTGPDMYMTFGVTGNETNKVGPLNNVEPDSIPFSFPVNSVAITDEEWTFKMMNANPGGTDQAMAKWVFNPIQEFANPIHLHGSGWSVFIDLK